MLKVSWSEKSRLSIGLRCSQYYSIQRRPVQNEKKMKILEAICVASLFLQLSFTEDDIRLPPSITRDPLRNQIYRNNDSITLDCKGTGVPNVTYEWKKNGVKLNEAHQNIQRGADDSITIQSTTSMDEGFYQCFARNQYGTALSITAHLRSAFLDSATGKVTSVLHKNVEEGEPFHIPCNSPSSFPIPTYGWEMANGTADENAIQLMLSNRIQIAENGDLHFAYALPEDELGGRTYRCVIFNTHLASKAGGNYTRLTVTRINGQFSSTLPADDLGGTTYWRMTSSTNPTTATSAIDTTLPTTQTSTITITTTRTTTTDRPKR